MQMSKKNVRQNPDSRDCRIARKGHPFHKNLGINETAAFDVGNKLVPGAIEVSAFKEVVAGARAAK